MGSLTDEPLVKRARNTDESTVACFKQRELNPNVVLDAAAKISPANQVGPYLLGQKVECSCPIKSINHYVARNIKSSKDKYYTLKTLNLSIGDGDDFVSHMQARGLIYTEYSLLSLLKGDPGVIQCHGLIKDQTNEKLPDGGERTISRVSLILDCLIRHDFSHESREYSNLQDVVHKAHKLSELESINILLQVARTVKRFHAQNIIHRDLKLSNLVLHQRSRMVMVTNFCLGKHLSGPNELLTDQRGAPAYTSPEILSGKPYPGKPSDIWSLGVIFYTLLYGQFPYVDMDAKIMHRKIKNRECPFPSTVNVSRLSQHLIKSMMDVDPLSRFTADETVDFVHTLIFTISQLQPIDNSHTVPDFSSAQQQQQQSTQQKDVRKVNDRSRRVHTISVPIVPDVDSNKQSDRTHLRLREAPKPSLTEVLLQQNSSFESQSKDTEPPRRAIYGKMMNLLANRQQASTPSQTSASRRVIINRISYDARPMTPDEITRLRERVIARRVGQSINQHQQT